MNGILRLVASSLLLSFAPLTTAGGAEYLRYTPEPSDGKPSSGPDEGILVKRITIEKGDTLYALSRKYSGKGTYFSQILLFNEIANPNLIYAGKGLLVPLPAGKGEGVAPSSLRSGKKVKGKDKRGRSAVPVATKASRETKPAVKEKAASHGGAPASKVSAEPAPRTAPPASVVRKGEESEQTLFEKGVSAYKTGQYQQSLDAFDRFLARYPNSPLVPDATLYRADALLKLAGQ